MLRKTKISILLLGICCLLLSFCAYKIENSLNPSMVTPNKNPFVADYAYVYAIFFRLFLVYGMAYFWLIKRNKEVYLTVVMIHYFLPALSFMYLNSMIKPFASNIFLHKYYAPNDPIVYLQTNTASSLHILIFSIIGVNLAVGLWLFWLILNKNIR